MANQQSPLFVEKGPDAPENRTEEGHRPSIVANSARASMSFSLKQDDRSCEYIKIRYIVSLWGAYLTVGLQCGIEIFPRLPGALSPPID
jgi:hypothetical protein